MLPPAPYCSSVSTNLGLSARAATTTGVDPHDHKGALTTSLTLDVQCVRKSYGHGSINLEFPSLSQRWLHIQIKEITFGNKKSQLCKRSYLHPGRNLAWSRTKRRSSTFSFSDSPSQYQPEPLPGAREPSRRHIWGRRKHWYMGKTVTHGLGVLAWLFFC